jgi:hypothetical protein
MSLPNQDKYVYEWSYSKSYDELQELPSSSALGTLHMYDTKQPVVTVSVTGTNLDPADTGSLMSNLGSIVTIGSVTGLLTSLSVTQTKGTPFASIKATLRMQS